jgi:hypothetical protein
LCAAVGADVREAPHRLATDGNHFAARLVIIAKIVLLRLSVDDVEEKVCQLLITCASTQWFHDVEFEIAAKTRPQFPVACKTKFVATLAKVKVGHRANKTDPLLAAGDLIIRSGSIRSKLRLPN